MTDIPVITNTLMLQKCKKNVKLDLSGTFLRKSAAFKNIAYINILLKLILLPFGKM